jgi:transforming growth factor-beta-induced protein
MGVKLNDKSNVVATDVQGTNGVIHVIDAVLLP